METVALGLTLGLGAGLAPGPLLALVVGSTLERGFAAGARVALGPLVTDLPIVVLSVLVLRGLPDEVLAGLSLGGALVVAWLAVDALRPARDESAAAGAASAPGSWRDVRRGALVNALSPHPWLFWITVGGPLVVEAGDDGAAVAAGFVAGFYLLLVGTKVVLAAALAGARGRIGARLGRVRIVSAALLGAAAMALAVDGLGRLNL